MDEKHDDDARLEVYVRMNDDSEKDYCFSVGLDDTFADLTRIFTTLNLSLRPSVFYEQIPQGFEVSTDPGYLTPYGGLLFNDDAHKTTKHVMPLDKISDHIWPGQLILPVWKFNDFNFYGIVLLFLTWLYTDLPDFISPTPGLCLTNQVTRVIAFLLKRFDLPNAAENILKETEINSAGTTAQCIFFAFHVFKCLMIFFILYFGMFNPYSLNPITNYSVNASEKLDEKKKQQLIAIGWTGSRRATLDEFRDYFRELEIKRAGGIVKASKLGIFDQLRNPGVSLGEGEGFQSDLKDKKPLSQMEENPEKFYLSYEYFAELGEHFEHYLATESRDVNKDIKDFRRYGPVGTTKRIKDIVTKRKAI